MINRFKRPATSFATEITAKASNNSANSHYPFNGPLQWTIRANETHWSICSNQVLLYSIEWYFHYTLLHCKCIVIVTNQPSVSDWVVQVPLWPSGLGVGLWNRRPPHGPLHCITGGQHFNISTTVLRHEMLFLFLFTNFHMLQRCEGTWSIKPHRIAHEIYTCCCCGYITVISGVVF